MSGARFVVGIDLGTTNSALAFVDPSDPARQVQTLPIPQLVREATVSERPSLPSFLYLGGGHDLPAGALTLPWDAERPYAVGEFAREQGARVPGRLVSSAKSWLCHGGVDREARILPWGAPEEVTRISPVEAASRYLQHLREVWEQRFPRAPLGSQEVVLTVPASFDEVARELTVRAATAAGLPRVVLLEEPQAALYAWVRQEESRWQDGLAGCRRILVVDVGGGTTDFSLVVARGEGAAMSLERHAVGDHLLLGGDNLDIALARLLEPRLGGRLDSQGWHSLTNLCRAAKETLLAPEAPAAVPIRLAGRGQSVIGGTRSTELRRDEVEGIVLDGFFPLVEADARPRRTARPALQEWGLPFASEAEITRHLAAFLARRSENDGDGTGVDALLFNGGALTPALIRDRLVEQLARWQGGQPPRVIASQDLDLAVARGAAYYGLVRRGEGVRIGGGAARSYYLALSDRPSGGGDDSSETRRVLCLAPRGMQEGDEIEIREPALEVTANQAVSFPLFASSTRLGDRAGALLEAEVDSLTELPPIRTVLRFGKSLERRPLPVFLQARLTEIGTLEVACRSLTTDHRWRLEFQLRDPNARASDDTRPAASRAEAVMPAERIEAARAALHTVFGEAASATGNPVRLTRVLEEAFDTGKDAWPLSAIRALWDELWELRASRGRSADHEARWLNLAGFLLRPGFGSEDDPVRVDRLWRLRSEGLVFPRAAQGRAEWWSLWKRIAGGLSRAQQNQLFLEVAPFLVPKRRAKAKSLPRVGPQEIFEYWQLLGSCELLPSEMKAELGEVLLPSVARGAASEREIWTLGRLGARSLVRGPDNCVLRAAVATRWVEKLLDGNWRRPEPIRFALLQIARCVGDRERDLDETLRQRVAERLRSLPGGAAAARAVLEVVAVDSGESARILDESLPVGLRLRPSEAGEG